MPSDASVLLERLARMGWFVEHGEVALTAGLTFCLAKDPAAARAFVGLIRDRTNLDEEDLPFPDRWQAESIDDNLGRIDVAGWLDAMDAPVVYTEAKVSAEFDPQQVRSYVASQQQGLRRAGLPHGALAVLVPAIRVRAACAEIARSHGTQSGAISKGGSWIVDGDATVTVTVISWDETLRVHGRTTRAI